MSPLAITAASVGAYVAVGALVFWRVLIHCGWQNANRRQRGQFYLNDDDVGMGAASGIFWPVALVIFACIAIKDSIQGGTLGQRLETSRPPRKLREDLLRKRVGELERKTGRWG